MTIYLPSVEFPCGSRAFFNQIQRSVRVRIDKHGRIPEIVEPGYRQFVVDVSECEKVRGQHAFRQSVRRSVFARHGSRLDQMASLAFLQTLRVNPARLFDRGITGYDLVQNAVLVPVERLQDELVLDPHRENVVPFHVVGGDAFDPVFFTAVLKGVAAEFDDGSAGTACGQKKHDGNPGESGYRFHVSPFDRF
jgi:hypothetical protein